MFPQFLGLLRIRGHVFAKGVEKGHEVQVPCPNTGWHGQDEISSRSLVKGRVLKSNGLAVLEAKSQPSGLPCARFSCLKTTWAYSSLRLRVEIFSSETGSTTQNAPSPKSLYGLVDTGICVKSLGTGLPVKKLKSIQGAVTGM